MGKKLGGDLEQGAARTPLDLEPPPRADRKSKVIAGNST